MAETFNGLRIELRPHIGSKKTPLGVVQVEHDQWIVMAHTQDGMTKCLGYLNKTPGRDVMYLFGIREEMPPVYLDEIRRQCWEAADKIRNPTDDE